MTRHLTLRWREKRKQTERHKKCLKKLSLAKYELSARLLKENAIKV